MSTDFSPKLIYVNLVIQLKNQFLNYQSKCSNTANTSLFMFYVSFIAQSMLMIMPLGALYCIPSCYKDIVKIFCFT